MLNLTRTVADLNLDDAWEWKQAAVKSKIVLFHPFNYVVSQETEGKRPGLDLSGGPCFVN